MTDVELIYSPSQIALACLHIVASPLAEEWARVKAPNESPNLLATIAKIQKIIEDDSSPPAIEVVKDIDKRLKICTNPEKVVGSKAYVRPRFHGQLHFVLRRYYTGISLSRPRWKKKLPANALKRRRK